MKTTELKLVYFSPTGTTRRVIIETARQIDLKSVSFDLTVHKEKKPALQFDDTDFVLFGIPVYSGRVPETFLSYFETLRGNNTPAALIATYGCRAYEDALLELKTEVGKPRFPCHRCSCISNRTFDCPFHRSEPSEQSRYENDL